LRVVEGVPPKAKNAPFLRRLLGEINLDEDGSFHIQVPANLPIELQALDADGLALRSCGWIWAKNKENRGCIGCHEDGERTPENLVPKALEHPATSLRSRRSAGARSISAATSFPSWPCAAPSATPRRCSRSIPPTRPTAACGPTFGPARAQAL